MRSNQTKRLKELERRGLDFLPFVLAMPGQTDEEARVAAGYAPDAPNPLIRLQFGRSTSEGLK